MSEMMKNIQKLQNKAQKFAKKAAKNDQFFGAEHELKESEAPSTWFRNAGRPLLMGTRCEPWR